MRLIQAGYIGGSPQRPQSAITIGLLRFFHTIWKYCTLRFQPFAEGLNEFLDAGNPLFLSKDGSTVSISILSPAPSPCFMLDTHLLGCVDQGMASIPVISG